MVEVDVGIMDGLPAVGGGPFPRVVGNYDGLLNVGDCRKRLERYVIKFSPSDMVQCGRSVLNLLQDLDNVADMSPSKVCIMFTMAVERKWF